MTDALLQLLKARSTPRGLVFARSEVLEHQLGCTVDALERSLARLAGEKTLRVLSPLPYLVVAIKPRMWPGAVKNAAKTAPKSGPMPSRGYSYSFQQQPIDQSNAMAIEDGGVGEGDSLLREILATLGETNADGFRAVLAHYPAAKIRVALQRVRATPPEKLRKSRTALFRYLLAKSK